MLLPNTLLQDKRVLLLLDLLDKTIAKLVIKLRVMLAIIFVLGVLAGMFLMR